MRMRTFIGAVTPSIVTTGSRSVSKSEQTKTPEVYSGVCSLSHRLRSVDVRVLSHQLVIRLAMQVRWVTECSQACCI